MTNVFGRHQSGTCTCCHLSRRGFIGGAAVLGLAGVLFAKPSVAAPAATLIGTRHHFFPPAYQKAWLEWEDARRVPHFPSQVAWSKTKAIEEMDEAGIRTAVLSIASTPDRKSTRLNSSHTVIYTLSYTTLFRSQSSALSLSGCLVQNQGDRRDGRGRHPNRGVVDRIDPRSEEHTSELQSHSDLHSFLHDALPISEFRTFPLRLPGPKPRRSKRWTRQASEPRCCRSHRP